MRGELTVESVTVRPFFPIREDDPRVVKLVEDGRADDAKRLMEASNARFVQVVAAGSGVRIDITMPAKGAPSPFDVFDFVLQKRPDLGLPLDEFDI